MVLFWGEYVDEVSLHSDDLDIALGFDYKFNEETGVLFITDVYGVVGIPFLLL